jgi:ubiquinone/menaquinone biosynthesis C-methylase UbiE
MSDKAHWERIFAEKQPDQLTWHQAVPRLSLALIAESGIPLGGRIIDVGGGTSLLADFLLDAGYQDITVADIAATALERDRQRLGARAAQVNWVEADITNADLPPAHYLLWHDRAVFHFLTNEPERQAYLATLRRALQPGGHVILATFALDGPERCSGLDVVGYGPASIQALFGESFRLRRSQDESHQTPWGGTQNFTYFHLVTGNWAPVGQSG